ncbi:hypothetical protein AOLI_G00176030 [Acnodon oligacanthus]
MEKYITDTVADIKTVKDFCDTEPEWTCERELEMKKMRASKTCADVVCLFFGVNKPKDNLKAVLKDTLEGLEKLRHFLGAVERLAVTSLFVFLDTRFPTEGVNKEAVRSVISAARTVSPLLIHFRRDDKAFFLPELDNVDLLVYQLHKYVCITQWLCKKMKSKNKLQIQDSPPQFGLSTRRLTKNVTDHLSQLSRIRTDKSFRLTFLVNAQESDAQESDAQVFNAQESDAQESNAQEFTKIYKNYDFEMSESLCSLEKNVACLDCMMDICSAFTIIGSFIGYLGGILSLTGLDIFPARTCLTSMEMGGALGITSAVICIVIGILDFAVDKCFKKKANKNINNFMKNMQKTADCLEQAASSQRPAPHLDEGNMELGVRKLMSNCQKISKCSDAVMDAASALEPLDFFFKQNTGAFFAVNAVSLVFDLISMCKSTNSILKRKKTAVSQLIRSRTALWRSEIEAWNRIYNSLREGKETFQENMDILERDIKEL